MRRTASRLLAWSRGRAAARLPLLLLLFGAGLAAGLLATRWGLPAPGGWVQQAGSVAPPVETAGRSAPLPASGQAVAAATRQPAAAPAAEGEAAGGASRMGLPGRLVWPADGMVVAVAGWRRHPEHGDWRYLPGLELAVPSGAPVRAAADGRVSGVEAGADGFTVVIDHGDGWSTVYGQLARVHVQRDQAVRAGAVIGYGPLLPDAVPALASLYGVGDAAGAEAAPAAVRGVITFAVYHGTESVDPLAVMPAGSFRVADGSEPEPLPAGSAPGAGASPVGP